MVFPAPAVWITHLVIFLFHVYVNLPMINWTSEWLAHMMGITPANKSIPFLYTSRLTTTMVTAKADKTLNNTTTQSI